MNADQFLGDTVARADEMAFESAVTAGREGKVLVAVRDDRKRAELSRLLHRRGHAFAIAHGTQSLVAHLRAGGVDLVVCEAQDAACPDFDLLALVRQTAPRVPVVVLVLSENEIERGQVDRTLGLVRSLGHAPEGRNALACLTAREREVLERIVAGRANKMIAFELSISPRTVENHRARVMEKLRAKTVADLVRIALTSGCGAAVSGPAFDSAGRGRAMAAR